MDLEGKSRPHWFYSHSHAGEDEVPLAGRRRKTVDSPGSLPTAQVRAQPRPHGPTRGPGRREPCANPIVTDAVYGDGGLQWWKMSACPGRSARGSSRSLENARGCWGKWGAEGELGIVCTTRAC